MDAHMLAERKSQAERVATLKAAHDKNLPGLLKARDAAARSRAQAQAAYQKADAEFSEAERAVYEANLTSENKVTLIEKQLRATAPEAIGAFVRKLDALAEQVRKEPPAEINAPIGFTGAPVVIGSNWRAIGRWLDRNRAVRLKAEALALEALDEAQLAARLDGLLEELGPAPTVADVEAGQPEHEGAVRRIMGRMDLRDVPPPAA